MSLGTKGVLTSVFEWDIVCMSRKKKGGKEMVRELRKITSKRTYNKLLLELTNEDYYPCKTCGRPVLDGYACIWCGDGSPQKVD